MSLHFVECDDENRIMANFQRVKAETDGISEDIEGISEDIEGISEDVSALDPLKCTKTDAGVYTLQATVSVDGEGVASVEYEWISNTPTDNPPEVTE